MSRTVRLSLALVFALMMVIATAGAALAFDPPDNDNASGLCGTNFPAIGALSGDENPPGVDPGSGAAGPWHATDTGPSPNPSGKAIDFKNAVDPLC